jgi:hypothetical protein
MFYYGGPYNLVRSNLLFVNLIVVHLSNINKCMFLNLQEVQLNNYIIFEQKTIYGRGWFPNGSFTRCSFHLKSKHDATLMQTRKKSVYVEYITKTNKWWRLIYFPFPGFIYTVMVSLKYSYHWKQSLNWRKIVLFLVLMCTAKCEQRRILNGAQRQ